MSEQIIYGLHAVSSLLYRKGRVVLRLLVNQERADQKLLQIIQAAKEANILVESLSSEAMRRRFPDFIHQGVVAYVKPIPSYNESHLISLLESSKKPGLILILDGITDPHNLGACLRTADAAGVDFVVIPKDKSASITPVVTKVASGAVELMPLVRVANLVRAMEILKEEGVWIYGASAEAVDSIYSFDFQGTIAMVMGAEGEGLRRLTRLHCDGLFSLVMLGSVASLNVSVAAGISLYEVVRQRQGMKKNE